MRIMTHSKLAGFSDHRRKLILLKDVKSWKSKGLNKLQTMASDASHMLEAALEQMDDIIAGTKSAAEYANGAYDIVSPAPSVYLGTFQILHLLEDLKMALEMLEDPQEKEALRNQIPGATAVCIREWFEENLAMVVNEKSISFCVRIVYIGIYGEETSGCVERTEPYPDEEQILSR
ncbi:hypothetical protein CIB84_002006 [Bambusicola thoracicus]|uniref:Uncharacterized protein n=1 Tax=Bambusicola thoracicus TaxID=9083 RepID=A0A2P4TD00_BAMTH|nr:hypothetical protein CIB84_002006 [Bambusicola thoracicus]